MSKKSSVQLDIETSLSLADPKLGRLIEIVVSKRGCQRAPLAKGSPFEALIRTIIYQQMAAKAACAIYKRFRQAIKGVLTPAKILALSSDELRALGLSSSKAKYTHNLAEWFNVNRKMVKNLTDLSDEEVIMALTSISGIGPWTANVFLMFHLQRLDIMPASDFGIRRGVQLLYGLKNIATPQLVHQKALRWQPYRSIASLYLWNALELKITVHDLK